MDTQIGYNDSPMENQGLVTHIESVAHVGTLPAGTTVGDNCGGRTFSDNIAAALERRSSRGWLEVNGWTVIVVGR